jgi:hypothetical protein
MREAPPDAIEHMQEIEVQQKEVMQQSGLIMNLWSVRPMFSMAYKTRPLVTKEPLGK